MNDITDELYKLIKAGDTPENINKIKTLFQLSDISKNAGLNRLMINLKSIKEDNGFRLNILSYVCWHLNFSALKFLIEERKDILSQIALNEGNPTPLFAAVFQGNTKKSQEIALYLIEKGADMNCRYSGSITPYKYPLYSNSIRNANLLHITMRSEYAYMAKVFLLHGVDYKEKDEAYYKTPYEIAKEDNKVEEIVKMMDCLDFIKAAKEAYFSKKMPMVAAYTATAYQKDSQFFIEYIGTEFININIGKIESNQDYSFLIKFIETIVFLSNSEFNQEPKIYEFFQEKVLPELEGYDARSGIIKIWDSNEKKHEYFKKLSKGTSWESTATSLKGFSSIFSQNAVPNDQTKNVFSNNQQSPTGFSFNKKT